MRPWELVILFSLYICESLFVFMSFRTSWVLDTVTYKALGKYRSKNIYILIIKLYICKFAGNLRNCRLSVSFKIKYSREFKLLTLFVITISIFVTNIH